MFLLRLLLQLRLSIPDSQNPSEKLHSGINDVATYFDKASNHSDKHLLDFMKNVYVPSKDLISRT